MQQIRFENVSLTSKPHLRWMLASDLTAPPPFACVCLSAKATAMPVNIIGMIGVAPKLPAGDRLIPDPRLRFDQRCD
jgi:hypothetical protein